MGKVYGGTTNYGQVAGILMLDSQIPRVPGDPGHAETFPFPVRYGVIRDFPFQDLVDIRKDRLELVIQAALELEREGVNVVAADCGLFSVFQGDIAEALTVPFLGSSLNLIPFIAGFLPKHRKIGVITGDTRLMKREHLRAAGAEPDRIVLVGMEHSQEFRKVVIERGNALDLERMREDTLRVAEGLSDQSPAAVVLECTNLATFRSDVQRLLRVPVFDAVSLIAFFVEGFRIKRFTSDYVFGNPNRGFAAGPE